MELPAAVEAAVELPVDILGLIANLLPPRELLRYVDKSWMV
jgi:hypothetical protein